MTLLRVFKLHNEKMKTLIGIDIVLVTYKKYLETETHVSRPALAINFIRCWR